MARRRVKSKRKRQRRPVEPGFDMECAFVLGGSYDDDVFSSPEEKRAAWEHYRDALMPDCVKHWPGERPAAWWEFDSPEPRNPHVTEWEQLLRLGQMEPEEIEIVRRGWLEDLRSLADSLRYVYHYHRQGVVRYYGYIYCDWPSACAQLEREAALLGSDAAAAWEKMKKYVVENADSYCLARVKEGEDKGRADDEAPAL